MRGDVSEIAIGVSYLNYIVLYLAVIRLTKKGEIKNKFMGYLIPVLAIAGSLVIILGSITHPLFIYYLLICLAIMIAGRIYYEKNKVKII
jgi:APA family basic amino acid/polyamine antiporter